MTIMDNPTWTLTDRLRKSRLLAGLEQAEIAELVGVSRNSVSNYENGKTELTATTFVRWAHATGVTLDWLAEGVNDKTPAEAGAVSTVSTSVRPEGFEPPTFCSVALVLLLFVVRSLRVVGLKKVIIFSVLRLGGLRDDQLRSRDFPGIKLAQLRGDRIESCTQWGQMSSIRTQELGQEVIRLLVQPPGDNRYISISVLQLVCDLGLLYFSGVEPYLLFVRRRAQVKGLRIDSDEFNRSFAQARATFLAFNALVVLARHNVATEEAKHRSEQRKQYLGQLQSKCESVDRGVRHDWILATPCGLTTRTDRAPVHVIRGCQDAPDTEIAGVAGSV